MLNSVKRASDSSCPNIIIKLSTQFFICQSNTSIFKQLIKLPIKRHTMPYLCYVRSSLHNAAYSYQNKPHSMTLFRTSINYSPFRTSINYSSHPNILPDCDDFCSSIMCELSSMETDSTDTMDSFQSNPLSLNFLAMFCLLSLDYSVQYKRASSFSF